MWQRRKEWGYLLLSTCAALLSFLIAARVSHVVFWLWMTSGLIATVFALGILLHFFFLSVPRNIFILIFQDAALVIFGIMIVVIGAEAFLGFRDHSVQTMQNTDLRSPTLDPEIGSYAAEMGMPLDPQAISNIQERQQRITLPSKWEQRDVDVPQAKRAYKWLGVLHVVDENNFRRTAPFPPKQANQIRVLVVGDSLTYGQGVDEQFIYPSLLQRELGKKFQIEILTLGVMGSQSEDVLHVVEEFLPKLHPDLVIYGVCQNDFLPSQIGEYTGRGFEFPMPESLEQFLLDRSRFARFVNGLYDQTLRAAGLRVDFYDDILNDIEGYRERFKHDVIQMNRIVRKDKLPLIVGMVLDQYPNNEGRGHQITKFAEQSMREAGFDVIDTQDYYRRFNGKEFDLKWDGHPNEEAHAIFASMIIAKLENHPSLQPYRK